MQVSLRSNDKFYRDLEATSLIDMFYAMGNGEVVSVSLDENESADGNPVTYYFIRFPITTTKPETVLVYTQTPDSDSVDNGVVQLNEIARFVNLEGVAIWYIFGSIPYCIPVMHSSPDLIANSIPGDGGKLLKDINTMAKKYTEDESLFDFPVYEESDEEDVEHDDVKDTSPVSEDVEEESEPLEE